MSVITSSLTQTNRWCTYMAECCCLCLVVILVKRCLRKTTVYTSSKNTCVCVILTHEDRMNTVFLITKPSWRQAVMLKPTGACCRCCKPSASTPNAKEKGCLLASALEGKENIYRESIQTEFLITNQLFHKVLVHWVQFEFTICCQCCQWGDLTISLIWLNSEKISGCVNSTTISLSLFSADEERKQHQCNTYCRMNECRGERNPPQLPLTTPLLTNMINMLLL